MARFEIPDGSTMHAFQFALDCTPEQEACLRRQFGGRRYARNWAVRTLKARPGRAGGDETRKGPSRQAREQPRDGVLIGDTL